MLWERYIGKWTQQPERVVRVVGVTGVIGVGEGKFREQSLGVEEVFCEQGHPDVSRWSVVCYIKMCWF